MADLLKITTPIINKTQVQSNKPPADPSLQPFDLREINKVVKPNPQSEMQGQNNGLIDKEEAPAILMDLLKDPSVTVNFLKNIFMLQEIIKLLPVNNQAFTQEIEQLFNLLMLNPDEIAAEMGRQEQASTVFKGPLFDFLRQMAAKGQQPELRFAIANLLKSINASNTRKDVMGAMANSLQYLYESLDASRNLSGKLQELATRYLEKGSESNFQELKEQTLATLKDVEGSILFTPKMAKVVSIMYYNLSRYNDNPDFFQEALSSLLTLLDGKENKAQFLELVRTFLSERRMGAGGEEASAKHSRVMDVLTKILGKQSSEESVNLMNPDKIEKIIHSLLSSPCNFTPLLHYVIPTDFMGLKSFAELWINPNGAEDDRPAGKRKDAVHMLVVFDIEGIGQFEAELFVEDKKIDLSLLCPPAHMVAFSAITVRLRKMVAATSYSFGEIQVDGLEKTHSLMDIFKSLPYKRTGVDVKV